MTTSTNNASTSDVLENETPLPPAHFGALADALTLVRVFLTPIIMFVIIKAWSGNASDPMGFVSLNLELVLLASVLFLLAALSDILDDFVGGSLPDHVRTLGWFDDIADSILVIGTLGALWWVNHRVGLLHWTFAIPVLALIGRDLLIALLKGFELSKIGFLETRMGNVKNALVMFATCILVASPWLTSIVDNIRANGDVQAALDVFNNPSHLVWNIGLIILWIGAVLSLITGLQLFKTNSAKPTVQTNS